MKIFDSKKLNNLVYREVTQEDVEFFESLPEVDKILEVRSNLETLLLGYSLIQINKSEFLVALGQIMHEASERYLYVSKQKICIFIGTGMSLNCPIAIYYCSPSLRENLTYVKDLFAYLITHSDSLLDKTRNHPLDVSISFIESTEKYYFD